MPLYEYHCVACRQLFDLLRPINQADAVAPCPTCGDSSTQRVISLFAVVTAQRANHALTAAPQHGCACGGACACARRN